MISKEIKFLLTHSSIYGLGTVVSRLVAFLLLPLYTRYLTPADYGVLETIDISSGIIGIVVTVGIARALSRFYYESEDHKQRNTVVSTTYLTYSVIGCLCVPVLFYLSGVLASILFHFSDYAYFFKISFISLLLGGLIDIGMMYLRLIKKPLIFITITVTRLLLLISFNVFFIVYLQKGILGILYSSLVVRCLYVLPITALILYKLGITFSLNLSRDMLAYSLPMIPSNLASTVVKQSDKYFVLYLLSIADMGIYSLALKLGNAIHSLMTIPFNMAYIPRRFEIMKQSDAKVIYSKIFTYYIFFIVYIGLGLSIFIPEILHFMVTPKFMGASELVPLVVLSMIIFGCQYHFDFGILYSKKTKYLAYINFTCAIINLGLNYVLIGMYGLFGAVWSLIIVLSLQAFLLYYFSNKFYQITYEFRRIFMYILVAGMFFGLSSQLDSEFFMINLGIKILLFTSFPFIVALSRIITTEEKAKLKEIYKSKIQSPILSRLALKGP